jgi:hypothetical protein
LVFYQQSLPKTKNLKIKPMDLPKALLSAILLGITVQTTSCSDKNELPGPKPEHEETGKTPEKSDPGNCPACGMG